MSDEIKLLKNNSNRTDSDLEKIREFYDYLTGRSMPKEINGKNDFRLSEKKAFTIIWYLQEHLSVFPDHIERCDTCGTLFDSWSEGSHWEQEGKNYCGNCVYLIPYEYR